MNLFYEAYLEENNIQKPDVICDDITELTEEEWLKMRMQGIGGSDAGTVYLGETSYKNKGDVARSKRTFKKDEVSPEQQYMFDFGHALEKAILTYSCNKLGAVLIEERSMFKHHDYWWMLADCDGMNMMPDGEIAGMECKTVNPLKLKNWKSGVFSHGGVCPIESYIYQVVHYMIVTGLKTWYLCAAASNIASDIVIIRFDWEDVKDIAKKLIDAEKELWFNLDYYVTLPPKTYTKENAKGYIDFCKKNSVTFDDADCERSGNEICDLQEKLAECNAEKKDLEERIKEREQKIKVGMGDNTDVVFGNVRCVIKTSTRKGRYNTKKLDEHPELAIFRNPEETYETLKITRISDDERENANE